MSHVLSWIKWVPATLTIATMIHVLRNVQCIAMYNTQSKMGKTRQSVIKILIKALPAYIHHSWFNININMNGLSCTIKDRFGSNVGVSPPKEFITHSPVSPTWPTPH